MHSNNVTLVRSESSKSLSKLKMPRTVLVYRIVRENGKLMSNRSIALIAEVYIAEDCVWVKYAGLYVGVREHGRVSCSD